MPAPTVLKNEDGGWADYSYINHYLCNGAVILCAFDDPHDEIAAGIFRRLFPEREIVLVDAPRFSRAGEASTASPSSSPPGEVLLRKAQGNAGAGPGAGVPG